MARPATTSIDDILKDTADRVVARVTAAISRRVGEMVEDGIRKGLASKNAAVGRSRRRARVDISKWVADSRARRVPNFVIEATGLDTKKKIVARFGENATFEKGKPLPKAKG
jgi:hypothetical protein